MSKATSTPDPKEKDKAKDPKKDKPQDGGWRETIESVAMAIILALLFRGFVAEAFVIPTGSMAPTLMGRHKDVQCPECGQWYKTGASREWDQDTNASAGQHVISATCPVCRYTQRLDPFDKPNDRSFSGDRIIVSKFAYEIGKPERWEVIVFKYPGQATVNYIKRLIGLPGETIQVGGGNIYTKKQGDADFQIARKPPGRLNAMLQLVDDTNHIPPHLTKLGWPQRWQQWPAPTKGEVQWQSENGGRSFTIDAQASDVWLRYRHIFPSYSDWEKLQQDQVPADALDRQGALIDDFAAYNAPHYLSRPTLQRDDYDPQAPGPGDRPSQDHESHWADDLAIDCNVQVETAEGEVTLDLVQAGVHHRCRIDLGTGEAKLTMTDPAGKAISFESNDGKQVECPVAQTSVKGAGTYQFRLSNIDREVLLWVNGSVVPFQGPTTYDCDVLLTPYWTPNDPLDLAPAGIAAKNCRVHVSSLKILRDIYYIAVDSRFDGGEYKNGFLPPNLFSQPEEWRVNEPVFTERRLVEFSLGEDQFFPMGDNSAESSDARIWSASEHYVDRNLLIGRAMCVYWPHTWNSPVPFTPNLGEMRRIR